MIVIINSNSLNAGPGYYLENPQYIKNGHLSISEKWDVW